MAFQPKKFGKFMLLDKIATGGMAEIFIAQTRGPGGFEKIVALKRILPQFSSSQEFISMFIDEARTTSQLTHSNIVQIYEFGHEGTPPIYYLAMELVDGKNLRQILARCEELKRPVPIEHAVYIASKICSGLDYAHRFRDKRAQESLQIIHRDISPQNVLVSFEGEAKLIDFGIAKTRAKSGTTKSGVLKGKFGYMSPEQAQGDELDQRTDIFSAGIILFEMLTRQRLFQSNNDLNTLKKIQESKIPTPSLFNPDIPFELEEIALRALEKNRKKRFQTAREFHQALSRFLNTLNPDFTASHVSSFVKSLFAIDILEHKKKMNEILISYVPLESAPPPQEVKPKKPSKETSAPKTITAHREEPVVESEPTVADTYHSPKRMWLQLSIMGLAILTLSLILLLLNQQPERVIQSSLLNEIREPSKETLHKPTTSILRIVTDPDDAVIFINGKRIGSTPIAIPRLPQQEKHELVIKKDGYLTLQENIILTRPSHNIKKTLVAVGIGYLIVKTIIDSDIEIDGKRMGRTPFKQRISLSTGKHRIRAIRIIDKETKLIAERDVFIETGETELLDEKDLVFKPSPAK